MWRVVQAGVARTVGEGRKRLKLGNHCHWRPIWAASGTWDPVWLVCVWSAGGQKERRPWNQKQDKTWRGGCWTVQHPGSFPQGLPAPYRLCTYKVP